MFNLPLFYHYIYNYSQSYIYKNKSDELKSIAWLFNNVCFQFCSLPSIAIKCLCIAKIAVFCREPILLEDWNVTNDCCYSYDSYCNNCHSFHKNNLLSLIYYLLFNKSYLYFRPLCLFVNGSLFTLHRPYMLCYNLFSKKWREGLSRGPNS